MPPTVIPLKKRPDHRPVEINHREAFAIARANMVRAWRAWVAADTPSREDVEIEIDGTAQQMRSLADLDGST